MTALKLFVPAVRQLSPRVPSTSEVAVSDQTLALIENRATGGNKAATKSEFIRPRPCLTKSSSDATYCSARVAAITEDTFSSILNAHSAHVLR